ncbi:hypothetical protein WJX72_005896 [[Myrmecia] bisecta]|uniref:Cyclin N-terminal domain-containing protein n=1 Tax=[Myrmecia] bisecta TaxID=41462 RepID=A0AAW1R6M8_9CHLO
MLQSPQGSASQDDEDDGCCYFSEEEEEDHDALHPQCAAMYPPIDANSPISRWAAMYDFSPFVTSVGTSYFARLAARDAQLLSAARANPCWAAFVHNVTCEPTTMLRKPVGAAFHRALSDEHWLAAVHITCIYLAAKNCETLQYKRLLQTMLTHIHACPISMDQAAALELECLQALEWRLGPFFL